MKRVKEKITAILNAIAFAEAGEHETAQAFLQEASETAPSAETQDRATITGEEVRTENFVRRIEEHLAAAAFAQAADFKTAQELASPEKRTRSLLLVIEGETPDPAAFSYGLALCRRMNLHMDILQVVHTPDPEREPRPLARGEAQVPKELGRLLRQAETEGVPFKATVLRGEVNQRMCTHSMLHKDVMMVVYDSPGSREEPPKGRAWDRIFESISEKLAVPVVTVAGKQPVGQVS
jgi:hypothetical protein